MSEAVDLSSHSPEQEYAFGSQEGQMTDFPQICRHVHPVHSVCKLRVNRSPDDFCDHCPTDVNPQQLTVLGTLTPEEPLSDPRG
jgi:hypothetical protein